MPPSLTLLGPQRLRPTVGAALDRAVGKAEEERPVAVVNAGWQEREGEDEELQHHAGRPIVNLLLHQRANEVFARRPELFDAHRERQDRLKRLQKLYRLRLDPTVAAARLLLARERPEEGDLIEGERRSALEALKALDTHHRQRLHKIHRDFRSAWGTELDRATADHRQELKEILDGSAALVIAGGHVAVLLNRLRLFGLHRLVAEDGQLRLPVVTWSAGAMALGAQVVLFHDRPPQGAGNSEVLDLGLDLYQGLVPFPHARTRLRLEDPVRVMLLSRRYDPARCVPLNEGDALERRAGEWRPSAGLGRLTSDGSLRPFAEESPSAGRDAEAEASA